MTTAIPAEFELQPATLAFLKSTPKKLLIAGEWTAAASGEKFPTYNPANGEILAQVALAGPEDVERAVQAARSAFESGPWSKFSPDDRGRLLWKLGDLIEAHADELAELETLDNGKPLRVARRGDIPAAVRHFRYYAGWATKIEGTTIPVSIPNQFVYTLREPMGVVGLIIPWNFPLLMCAWKLAPALASGNTCLLKPAEETPLSALLLGELALEAGFPEGVINIITGPGVPTGSAMVKHLGIDKISFTGSTEVGREIMRNAAVSNLKRVSLELGGKSPNVIFADADLEKAVRGATWAVFSTAGQECVAGSRLFIERPVFHDVLASLKQQAEKMRIGPGFSNPHIGPLVSEQQLERVMGYIQSGKDEGAEVITGGERPGDELADGYFLKPTIFTHDNDQLKIVREEIFGPVVAATPFDHWEEVVERTNNSRYGLAAGVWTREVGKAHRFAEAVKAGTVWVNGYGMFDPAAPFGGYKESGFGREMGKDALDLYTQVKTVWVGL
jgi:acyl-CoA reductase-like NAD-dependent aldehyde dehydrogenase